ncbi:MAG: hypothetical protein ABI615_09605 [Chthoniobacterales bacterium]
MYRLLIIFALAATTMAQDDFDNREPKPVTVIPFSLHDEIAVLGAINRSENQELLKALGLRPDSKYWVGQLRMVWNQRISLKDADYVLCLFDPDGRAEPGNNPRILILLSLDYHIKTWGEFTCEPAFAFGTIINQMRAPNTFFVTVNVSSRNGHLWFEKYRISSDRIEKLGEGPEVTQIKEP